MIFADTETHPFTPTEPVPVLVVNGFSERQGTHLVLRDDTPLSALQAVFEGDSCWAGPQYDMLVLLRAYPELQPVILDALRSGRVHDVLLREKQIDHAYGARKKGMKYDLGEVARRRSGLLVDKNDPWRLKYGGLDGVPLEFWPEGALSYARSDVDVLPHVYDAQEQYADLMPDQTRQVCAAVALAAHGARGMTVDQDLAHVLDLAFDTMRKKHERVLVEVGLARPKTKQPGAPLVKAEKKAKALIVSLGQDYVKTPTHTAEKPSPGLSQEALDALDIPDDHPLHAYRALGSLVTKRNTYLNPLLAGPVVRTSYDPCVSTNRTSSYDPNLQNQPRDIKAWIKSLVGIVPPELLAKIAGLCAEQGLLSPGIEYPSGEPMSLRQPGFRECLIARPGHVFVVSDWSMVELVCLAQICIDWFGWSKLGDALREGRDAHEELGSIIAGFDISTHPDRKIWRTVAKAPNFGYPGGLGADRFVAWANAKYGWALEGTGIVIDIAFAKVLKQHWRRCWPEMKLYADKIGRMPKPITMRLDRTGYVRGGMSYTEASNFSFQALAASAAKSCLFDLFELSMTGGLAGGFPVLFVHDENVIEVPEANAPECAAIVESTMLASLAQVCPDVPGGVETTICTRYTK